MTSVLRKVWTEFCEGGAYRERGIISVSWRAGKAWFMRLRILICTGENKSMPGGVKKRRQKLGS